MTTKLDTLKCAWRRAAFACRGQAPSECAIQPTPADKYKAPYDDPVGGAGKLLI